VTELYRHTDFDGETMAVRTDEVVGLVFFHRRGVALRSVVSLTDDEGRRLLAALQKHYAAAGVPLDDEEEKTDG
jgi:hypothetical protein